MRRSDRIRPDFSEAGAKAEWQVGELTGAVNPCASTPRPIEAKNEFSCWPSHRIEGCCGIQTEIGHTEMAVTHSNRGKEMTMRNTELELRPLEAHELDIVNGAGVPIHTAAGFTGLSVNSDVVRFGWWGEATTVSKPIQLLAGSGPSQVDIITWPK